MAKCRIAQAEGLFVNFMDFSDFAQSLSEDLERIAPHYRKGDLIFVKPETTQPADHVFLKRKATEPVFGVLVHRDARAVYVRGFKAGDRIQSVPLSNIREWGRIIVSYRV